MAYMVAINTACQFHGCKKPRTHAVFNQINDRMGEYCKRHAEERLGSLQATENKLNAQGNAR